ncbi:MAG: hypothetical protein WC423_23370 [Vulcanimicrobiota bacterium]
MLSIRNILTLALVPLFLVVVSLPAEAQRGNQRRSTPRMQRKAPQVRSMPRAQVHRSAPRPQVRHSAPRTAPRQVHRSAPRQVHRAAPQRQATRSAPRMNRPQQTQRHQVSNRPSYNHTLNRHNRGASQQKWNRAPQQSHRNTNSHYNAPPAQAASVRRPVGHNTNTNVNTYTNVNVNNTYRRPVYTQPVYANTRPVYSNRTYCPPTYHNGYYSPVIYNDYHIRRSYRRYNNCANLFFSLGFFLSRPYSYYDYAHVGYNNPIIYGDDRYYRPPTQEGGPQPDAVTSTEDAIAAAPTQPPTLSTPEEKMLGSVAEYVEKHSVEGQYRISDAAFSNQVWLLDLAQAPAVFEIKDGLYSVVAGFEGTLGTSNVPSNVNVEFFVAKTAQGFEVRDAWITSANGIARTKLYQSPVYPDVKTWEAGKKCPFSGQSMIPLPPKEASEQG